MVFDDDIFGWYEHSLSPHERKMRGHFSTPSLLVEQILDACGYKAENDLSRLRVLDPACGSGNFLVGALRRLLAFAHQTGLSKKQRSALIQRNLWGIDPDPVSCFLAEMQLRTTLSSKDTQLTESAHKDKTPALHIHQADALAIPWQQTENIDLFLANPPYLAAKNNDLSSYRSAWQRGQIDSYLLFLDLALHVVRPGGWIGLVLPDPVLARANARHERQLLLQKTTIHHLWHLAGVFNAYVGAVVIVAQKCPLPRRHQVSWMRGRWQQSVARNAMPSASTNTISQMLLASQPSAEMRYLLSDDRSASYTLVKDLHEAICEPSAEDMRYFVPLNDLVSIRRGEELSKDSASLSLEHPIAQQEWHPVLRGGVDVQAYREPTGPYWIARTEIKKPLERYLVPKLLVVKSTGNLRATLDLRGHIVLQTLYMLHLRAETRNAQGNDLDELYFLLALLNSHLLRTYVYVLHTAYKWVHPQIEQHVLAHLPVPGITSPEKAQIIARAKILQHTCRSIPSGVELKEQEIYEEQERSICALYKAALLAQPPRKSVLAIC